jgi:lysophospholipase L1-like esterase
MRGANWSPNTYFLIAWLTLLGCTSRFATADEVNPHAFEGAIQEFEALDRQTPPPEQPIVFVGSSSIRMWNLSKSFSNLPVLNRGFGGSQIADSVYFAQRIVIKYKPRMVVFYAGDNDLASGKQPAEVLKDFQEFTSQVHAALPKTRIVFISIKPSIARWKLIDSARRTNSLIADFIKSEPRLTFVDVEPLMLGPDGKPRGELFIADGLHMNTKGYELWASLIAPLVK